MFCMQWIGDHRDLHLRTHACPPRRSAVLREVRAGAADYPEIERDEVIVDAAAALLIRDPGRFDVIVTTNMFGDILSDESSELTGSLGLGGSINAGDDICVAQAQHGSAPDIAGRSEEHTSELQSLMRISYAVFCMKKKKNYTH